MIQLRAGTRDVSRISLDFARACAAYLDTSTLNVLLLAGSLDIGDFSAPSNPQRRITEGLHAMLEDPVYAAFVDEPLLKSLPAEVQNLLVSLYEESCQREFGMSRKLPPMLWSSLRLATHLAAQDAAPEAEVGQAGDRDAALC